MAKAKAEVKLPFGCVPEQAERDTRLNALHHRALIRVARRDLRSIERGEGDGCTENLEEMAKAIRANATNLCTVLGQLTEWGYLRKESQFDRRLKAYRVVYSTLELPIPNPLPTVERSAEPDRLPRGKGVLCPENQQALETPTGNADNKRKKNKKKESGFGGWDSEDFPLAVRLALFEQALESGEAVLTRADHDAVLDVYGDHPPGHPDHERAVRILDGFAVTDDDDHHHDQHADEKVLA